MLECHVVKAESRRYLRGHTYFLSYAVDEMEAAVGIGYGQRDAGQTAASAHVEKCSARLERTEESRNGKAVKNMGGIQVVDVAPRNHVDTRVPLPLKAGQSLNLSALALVHVRKISEYYIVVCHNCFYLEG